MATANLDLKGNYKSMFRIGSLLERSYQTATTESLEKAGNEPTTSSEAFEDRKGYDPAFLDGWKLPIPVLKKKADMRELRRGGTGVELKYHHFSVIISVSKRLPLITAVNINGALYKPEPRITVWSFDGRLNKEDQVGDELYDNNILDRGHMVRREDPVWGERASVANIDTFHFTNSCPQVGEVNQQVWLGLENYVLSHAKSDDMLVNVYTGPIFRNDDMKYRDVQIPSAFWKVVAIVTDDGRPSATAYKISQKKELGGLEFVFGAYKTFQVSIRQVEKETGVDFGEMADYDGFSQLESATGEIVEHTLESLSDVRI